MDTLGEAVEMRLPGAPPLPLDGLHRLSAAVNRAERLEQIYDAAIAALLESLNADRASILLYDAQNVMRFVASHGLSEGYRKAVEGHSPWNSESLDPRPILVDDVEEDPDLAPYLGTILGEGIRALAFIPLLYRGRLLGKFMVYFDQRHQFDEQERLLSQTIANHVAFAIEQKKTEQNLLLYRKIFEHSPTGIGIVDTTGNYMEQNASHSALIGYSSQELVDHSPAIHLGIEGFSRVFDGLAKNDYFHGELTSTTKDRRQIPIELSAFIVRDEDGNPICAVGMKHDITERKEAERRAQEMHHALEDRVIQRTAELQHAKEEMEGFCYSVSHDLRTPLRGITGAAMMLLEDYSDKLDDDGKYHLKRLSAASSRMAQLIDDLLQYSRLGRKEPRREPIDLQAVAEKVVEDIRRRNSKCESLDVQLNSVPVVEADVQLMEIVLHNLFENACKFTSGRPSPRLAFGFGEVNGRSGFYVRDNGVGFDPQYAGKLFRPFERLHSESEYPGTGIGLANVKRIIERHGGEIWCDAKLNEGATFYFTIGE